MQVGRDPPPLVLGALDRAREEADTVLLGALELCQCDGELSLRGLCGLPRLPVTLGSAKRPDIRDAEGRDEQGDHAR